MANGVNGDLGLPAHILVRTKKSKVGFVSADENAIILFRLMEDTTVLKGTRALHWSVIV